MSENKKARVIIRKACPRDCSYCCNKKPESLASAKMIDELAEVIGYNEIMVSGGEPGLNPSALSDAVLVLRHNNPDAKLYLYSANVSKPLYTFSALFDGLHYGIHRDFGKYAFDEANLLSVQQALLFIKEQKSFSARLWIESECSTPAAIVPSVWDRIDVSPALDNCPLPEGEDLFILKEDLY